MESYLKNLKENLKEFSIAQLMITVKRSDLESLIDAYEAKEKVAAGTATTVEISLDKNLVSRELSNKSNCSPFRP